MIRKFGPKLNEAQLKLWEPVEAQLRASFDARQKLRADWRAARERGPGERPSLADRVDRMSQRLTERAERAKALATVFRPFYASLTEDQKDVANVLMRRALRGHDGWGGATGLCGVPRSVRRGTEPDGASLPMRYRLRPGRVSSNARPI